MPKSFHSLSADAFQLLRQHVPRLKSQPSRIKAAVSVILREGPAGTEILLMQRAYHEADPWSGQMAFPGGKIEKTDAGARQAAMRETLEEVGIRLTDDQYIGQLNDLYGFKMDDVYVAHLSSFVFYLQEDVSIVPNYEVADTVWLPLAWLESEHNYLLYETPRVELPDMPSVCINLDKQQILWGLTLRIVVHFFDIIKHPMRVLDPTIRQRIAQIELDEE